MKLVWSAKFTRAAKRAMRKNPSLMDDLSAALELLESDHSHPGLRTHKLKGELDGCWACSAGYDLRLVFEFRRQSQSRELEIHLLNVGTHDEVY
jgi:addiction module RelE/StbE family toxin